MRLTEEQLEEVKKKYNVSRLWSWSRLECFRTSPYEYYLKHVIKAKPDSDNCAYAPLGGIAHDTIEKFYNGEIQYEDMIENFKDGWLTAIDIADLKFNRADEEKNRSIGDKYKENLEHFFMNHVPIKHKVILEQFTTAKFGNHVLQGYIDAVFKDNEDCYNIVDWKTSTKYYGSTLEEHSGQLTVYAVSLMQKGIPLNKIKCCFNFLKYVTVEYTQANGAVKTRDIERCKIGESLQSNAKVWLKKFGYQDQLDDYLKLLIDTNSIKCLPEEVQEMYKVSDCYVYIDLTEKLINKWEDVIKTTIIDIMLREKDYEETSSEKAFWDSEENLEKESYYFATLCEFSPRLHKPYGEYLQKREEASKGMDFFSGVGSANEDVVTTKAINNKSDELDLSWLDEI